MSMLLDGGGAWAVERKRAVTIEAKAVGGLAQLRVIFGAVNVVATEAGDAAAVHHALHEIISLHAIFVRGAVGEMGEGGFAESVFLKLPIILQIQARVIADGPVVIFAFDRIGQRAALRVALDAGGAGRDVIHASRIENVAASGMLDMFAAGAVAAFAADIPFGNLFGVDVVVHGVAAITERAGGALHIVRRIKSGPPVGAVGDEIGTPNMIGDIPLRGLRKIVVAVFGEVALLPNAAVNERDVVFGKFGRDGIFCEVGNDGVGKFARVADHVGHGRFSPVLVNLGVAFLASE